VTKTKEDGDTNINIIEELVTKIDEVIDQSENVTQGEVIAALLLVLGPVLGSIQCRGCREIHANSAKKFLAKITESMLKAPGHSKHVH
jgi:hypothetical protein